jgi:hypothetical protein
VTNSRQAAEWVAQQVDRDAIVACDPVMCSALEARGFPAGKLRILRPKASYPLSSTVVIVTPAVRSWFGTRLDTQYAPEVMASFGSGNARIDIRVFDSHGAAAYRSALNRDLMARKSNEATLLNSSQIAVSAAASKQIEDGEIDSRLIYALTNLAGLHPIDILWFGNLAPGASAGIPLRFADLAETDGAAHMGSSAYVRSMLASLKGALYRPARAESVRFDGQAVVRIEFPAPSPLGVFSS